MKRTALLLVLSLLLLAGCASVRRVYDPMDETATRNVALKAPVVVVTSPVLLFVETIATVFSGPPNLPGGDCTDPDCVWLQVQYLNRKPSWRFAAWMRRHVLGESGSQGR